MSTEHQAPGAVGSPVEQELGLEPERSAFEAWATDQGLALNRHRHSYAATATAWCWDAWQGGRAAERERWQELAEHLRHCRDCGEEDVARCYNGAALWKAATGNDPGA